MNLIKVVTSVQNILDAISSVMNVDVTVVDDQLTRIAATGKYKSCTGQKVGENSAFGHVLRSGEKFIIENPKEHFACTKCENVNSCQEYAGICCPITINGETIGVIGLVAFEEEQRNAFVSNKSNLMNFLNRMAELISSKALEQENTDRIELLAKELETVLNTFDRGVIAVNDKGKILRYNKKANKLFHIEEEGITELDLRELIGAAESETICDSCKVIKSREFVYNTKNYPIRGFLDLNPICSAGKNLGIVFTFSDFTDVLNIVNKVSNSMIETGFDQIIGESHMIKAVKREAEKAAKSTSTILIQGASGTGKELFARAIHSYSSRAKGPFIAINCSAIPEQLLESELFGYVEGAFTGAKKGGKAGKFELASKGTIFLDEIGDMQLHLQAKLLRVLQERVIEKVGGKEDIPIDVRVIAATNKDLEKKVLEGEFRQDLFYRLNVIPLNIPSLKDRREDITMLVDYLLDKCNKKLDKQITAVQPAALLILQEYSWPGNVRELENTIEYAVNMSSDLYIKVEDLPNRLRHNVSHGQTTTQHDIVPIGILERQEIVKALGRYSNGKQAMGLAAEALGISRATLYRKIKEYQIDSLKMIK